MCSLTAGQMLKLILWKVFCSIINNIFSVFIFNNNNQKILKHNVFFSSKQSNKLLLLFKRKRKIFWSYLLKAPVEEILYASSGVVPDGLVVVWFVGRPLRFIGAMAWFALLWVMGSDVGVCLPLFRDSRFFSSSTG